MTTAVNWIQREQDIGVNLNAALHKSEPSRFRFLLASLSPHAPDWQTKPAATPTKPWVAPFGVGVQRPLYARKRDWQESPTALANHSFMDWFLHDCLNPEALVASTEEVKVPPALQASIPHWLLARDNERSNPPLQEADLIDLLDQVHTTV